MSTISSCFAAAFSAFGWEGSVSSEVAHDFVKSQSVIESGSITKSLEIAAFAQMHLDRLTGDEKILVLGTGNDSTITFLQNRECTVFVHDDESQIKSYQNALTDAYFFYQNGCYQISGQNGKIFTSGGEEFDLIYACGHFSQQTLEMIEEKLVSSPINSLPKTTRNLSRLG